jgi:hypothetical protein
MAGKNSVTARGAAEQVLALEHADALRESVALMVREIMEAEIAQLAGAELGERTRPPLDGRAGQRVPPRRRGRGCCPSPPSPPGLRRRAMPPPPLAREEVHVDALAEGEGQLAECARLAGEKLSAIALS